MSLFLVLHGGDTMLMACRWLVGPLPRAGSFPSLSPLSFPSSSGLLARSGFPTPSWALLLDRLPFTPSPARDAFNLRVRPSPPSDEGATVLVVGVERDDAAALNLWF